MSDQNNQLEIDFDAIDKYIAEETTIPVDGTELLEGTSLLHFKSVLNKKPPKTFLKKNEFYGNLYMPLEVSERILSALFKSYSWNFSCPPVVEEGNIIFCVTLTVVNPITEEKETFIGTSAVPIKPVNGTTRDIHPHIPAAKSYAMMNACKHIGRLFRAENDNITKIFDTYFEDKMKEPELSKEADRLIRLINKATKVSEVQKYNDRLIDLKQTDKITGDEYNVIISTIEERYKFIKYSGAIPKQ